MSCPLPLLLVLAVPGVTAGSAPQGPPFADIFDRFARGHVQESVNSIASGQDLAASTRDIRAHAPIWIHAARLSDVGQRRLIVATLVLEVAHTGVEAARTRPFAQFWDKWVVQRSLLEWACALLRLSSPPLPPERFWHVASLVLSSVSGISLPLRGCLATFLQTVR